MLNLKHPLWNDFYSAFGMKTILRAQGASLTHATRRDTDSALAEGKDLGTERGTLM